jgi:hypothetical protein
LICGDSNGVVRERVFVEVIENIVEYFGGGCGDGVEGSDNRPRFDGYFVDFENEVK